VQPEMAAAAYEPSGGGEQAQSELDRVIGCQRSGYGWGARPG